MIRVNGKAIHTTMFPDNTSQVWQLDPALLLERFVTVQWDFTHEGEFLQLAQLKELLDHHHVKAFLELPYLPYGRQDKMTANDATFALRPFAKLLNALKFEEVAIVDPHSFVATDLINESVATYPIQRVHESYHETRSSCICYPDKGASARYKNLYGLPFISGDKVRNPQTGFIEDYALYGTCAAERVLIVDDICDGGATFTALAKALHAGGAYDISLFVTHGIFSKGVSVLLDAGISRIFTAREEITRRSQLRFQ